MLAKEYHRHMHVSWHVVTQLWLKTTQHDIIQQQQRGVTSVDRLQRPGLTLLAGPMPDVVMRLTEATLATSNERLQEQTCVTPVGKLRSPALTPPSSSSARGRRRASRSSTLVDPAFRTIFIPEPCIGFTWGSHGGT